MDKGKSKTDLRAAGKKRLEEFRQKKNQKGGTGKVIIPTATSTLKTLTESELGSEDNGQEGNSGLLLEDHSREDRRDSCIDSSEETLVSRTKGSEEETALLGSAVAVDPSLISPIQTARSEAHLSVEASDQCDSLSQPGSAEQGLHCESELERKAVYTILWETPATDHTQTNEDCQENTYEGAENFANKGLDQGNYPTFRLEDNFSGQNRDGFNSKEHSNGVGEHTEENVQLIEETTEKDLQETLESKGFRDDRCVDPSNVETLPLIEHGGQFINGEGLLKREVQGDENLKSLVEEQPRVLEEKGRDLDGFRSEIEVLTLQSEKEVQIEHADKERQQFVAEIEEVKNQMQKMVNEKKQLLQAASDREMLLISELGELRDAKDEENSQFVLQLSKLHQQLQQLGDEKSLFAERYNVTHELLDNLHGENLRLVEESAHEQQKREVSFSMELATWKDQVEGLKKERLESQGLIKELSDSLKRLESNLQEMMMLNSHMQGEKTTLTASIMELNQFLQAVEEEKTQLGIELDELKDERAKSSLVVEELHLHIQTLETQAIMDVTEVTHLNESLKSLGDEKVELVMALNDSNQKVEHLNLHVEDLEKAIGDLESGNKTITQELQSLGEEKMELAKLLELSNQNVEALKLELQGWENKKSTYFSEIEALSEQLQGLKQGKIDLEKVLEDSFQETKSLMSQVQGLEEDRRSYVSEEALLNQRLQSFEEEKAQLVKLLEDSGHQVDALNLQVQSLQDEISVLISKDAAAVQRLQCLEEEKIQVVELLKDSNKKMETLSLQTQSLEEEMGAIVSENKILQQQLQVVDEKRRCVVKCLEDANNLVQATFKSQCLSMTDEKQDLLSALSALQQHSLDMSEERDQLIGDLKIAREHIRMLEIEKEELGLRALKSKADGKRIREEGQELMMQLDSSRQEVTRMTEERSEWEKQLMELNQGREQWSKEQNEVMKELEGCKQQVARLAEERLKLLKEIEISQQEVQQLGCNMIESKEERRQVEKQLESELQLLHQKLEMSESEKIDLNTLLGTLRQELQQITEDQELKSAQLEELSKHLQSETEEHASIVKKLQEVFHEKQHLTSELKASQLLLQETQSERKQAEHKLQLLQQKLENNVEEKDRLANELEESHLHAQDLNVGNAELSSRLEQMQEVCRKRDEENTQLQAFLKELEQQTTVQQTQTSFGDLEKASSQPLQLEKNVKDEEVRPSNHSVKNVMNLVKEFEVRASEDSPQKHLRLVASPGKELFSQAQSLREALDALQQERDTGIQTEQALRVQLEVLLRNLQDSNDERSHLTASLMELEVHFHALQQQIVEWADQMYLDIEALKETKSQLSGFVEQLKGEIVSLQKTEEFLPLKFAEIERKAMDEVNARLQNERQSQFLASKLQGVETELGELKDENVNLGEKLETSVLERHMLEEGFKELQDAYTQLMGDKVALETLSREEKAQHDMNLEYLKLGAEELNQKLKLLEGEKTLLQQEKESILLDFTIFRSDMEKTIMESDAVVAKLKDEHFIFQTNLQAAVCESFPDTEGKQQDVVGTSFESCWKLVNTLVDKSIQLVGLQTQLQEASVDEKAHYAATLQAMEVENEVLKQTNKDLSSKVQILASEVEQAASEGEQLRQMLASETLEIQTLQTEKQDLLAVRDLEVTGLKQKLEEVMLRSVQQDEQLQALMQQIQTLEADVSKAREDCSTSQTEVVQIEKKLSNTKERLTLAISKGRSVVQQRDAVKQALKEKTEELEHLISSHAELIKAKDMALHEAEEKASSMAAMADRASLLDGELAIAQDTILSLEHALHEARTVTQDVQFKLETMGVIPQGLSPVAKIEWLAATLTATQSKAEDLANNAVTFLTELATSKQESETLAARVVELNSICVKLEELVTEASSEKLALASEIVVLQRVICEMDLAMKAEMAAHLKLQKDLSVAMKLLKSVFQEQMLDAEESHPSFSLGLVESAIARIVEKYKSEAHKVEELTHQIAVMAQEAENAKKERDLSMDQHVQQIQEMLDYTQLELRKTMEKVREADVTMTQRDEENQVLVQQAQRMQSELLKTSDKNMSLQADVVMTNKRLSDVRDRLLLGLVGTNADVGDISKGESPAQPLSEKAGKIQVLADVFCVEMQKKDAALQEVNERSLGMAATVSSLELELDSLRKVSEECKQILMGFADATSKKGFTWPNELSSSSIAFPSVGIRWLINTLDEEQQKASQAMQEVERLEKAVDSVTLEVKDQKGRLEELSNELMLYKEENAGLAERLQVLSSEHTALGELAAQVDEKDALQAEFNQMEQKFSNTREKLDLAVKNGKAVEKQRDALKKSLEEKTQELDSICIFHREELKVKDTKLHESREKFQSLAEHVLELEFQLTSTSEKVAAAEQSMQENLRFRQEVDIALSHISLPISMKTSTVIEKIESLGMMLSETQSRAVRSERELEVLSSKLGEVQEKVQFLEMENSNGKEMILLWAKKAEEVEIRAISDRAQCESELEFQSQALREAEARTHAAVAEVEEMQGALQQKQNSLKSMEVSRGKAISKLTLTLNRLTELRQQSEGLVTEIENLHGELQNRDAEILRLKEKISIADAETRYQQERFSMASAEANLEILKLRKELAEVNSRFEGNLEEMAITQNNLTQKTVELEKLEKHLEMLLVKEDSPEQAEQSMVVTNHISRSAFEGVDVAATNGTVNYVATIDALQQHIENLKSEGQLWRVNMERKDAQLQGLREELDELVKERSLLQAGIQAKQFQIDRMQGDMAVIISSGSDTTAIPAPEIEELGARNKCVGHVGTSAATHVRGARKPFPAEVTIDVDGEINPLLSDLDDKGHGFNSLTNSALVPKRMRALADRLDGLCVVGGRLLMRQPTARLGLALYWIAIHVYMAMIVSRAIL